VQVSSTRSQGWSEITSLLVICEALHSVDEALTSCPVAGIRSVFQLIQKLIMGGIEMVGQECDHTDQRNCGSGTPRPADRSCAPGCHQYPPYLKQQQTKIGPLCAIGDILQVYSGRTGTSG
jgi:hypothetical protein